MPTLKLYHGTAHEFSAFDDRFAVRGAQPNTALGVCLTERPESAAEYADMATRDRGAGEPRVLVVEADVNRMVVCDSRDAFLGETAGRPSDGLDAERQRFSELRERLMAEGVDAVAVDDIGEDIAGTWVVFDPARVRIVGSMTPEEAEEAECEPGDDDVEHCGPFPLPEDCAPSP